MQGVSVHTGKPLSGTEHLRQSITDILTTPIGTRVMRRDYGSRLFDLIDAPSTPGTVIDIYSAAATAIKQWEPRYKVSRIRVAAISVGRLVLDIFGLDKESGQILALEGIEIA